jgi:hypothetical protein
VQVHRRQWWTTAEHRCLPARRCRACGECANIVDIQMRGYCMSCIKSLDTNETTICECVNATKHNYIVGDRVLDAVHRSCYGNWT